jgi:hypothetical protein
MICRLLYCDGNFGDRQSGPLSRALRRGTLYPARRSQDNFVIHGCSKYRRQEPVRAVYEVSQVPPTMFLGVDQVMSQSEPGRDPMSMLEHVLRRAGTEMGFDAGSLVAAVRNEQESRPTEDELFQIESQLWDHFLSASLAPVGEFQHAQLVAWSWIAQAYRQAHSAFVLYQQGFPDSSFANARCAIEHGVYLSLLSGVESVDSVLGPLEHSYLQNAKRAVPIVPEEETELLTNLIGKVLENVVGPRSKEITILEQVCNRLDTGKAVYAQYRSMSNLVHTGFGIAAPYAIASFEHDADSPSLSHEVQFLGYRIGLLMAIGGCAWAGWSADRLFDVEYFGPLLDSIARNLGFQPLEVVET